MIALMVRTLNEESRIEKCLRYHGPHVDYIHVHDGGSTDGTIEIAERYADRIVVDTDQHWGRFTTRAVEQIPRIHVWVLVVDADEVFDKDFLRRMRQILYDHPALSYRFPRINLAENAADYPDYQIRFVKRGNNIKWMNQIDEAPTLDGVLLSKLGADYCLTLHKYPITHLREKSRG